MTYEVHLSELMVLCRDGSLPPAFTNCINSNTVNAFLDDDALFTPLKEACLDPPRDHVVRFLLDNGASPNLACIDGYAPLHTLGSHTSRCWLPASLNILRMLVAAGANVNAMTHPRGNNLGRRTVLYHARFTPFAFQCALIDCGARMADVEMESGHMPRPVRRYLKVGRGKCLAAARTMLLIRCQRREPNILHAVGKDIVRLLVQWVWGTRTDPIWCDE
jgi:hypothetical protein